MERTEVADPAVAKLIDAALQNTQCQQLIASIPELPSLVYRYYANSSVDDLVLRDPVDLIGAVVSQRALAEGRQPGTPAIRIFTPTVAADGWSCEHTVVEIVTEDQPFIVDSVSAALNEAGRTLALVIHPIVETDHGTESWVHIEIDRESETDVVLALESMIKAVLADVRAALEDWPVMRDRAALLSAELLESPPVGIDPEDVSEAAELLSWLATDHFTFLGYREYDLEISQDGSDVLVSKPETGLGILRSKTPTRKSFAHLPPQVQQKAREQKLLIVTKANRRSTVHRPTYLDYVGIKKFDSEGKVTGELRFVGLLSAATYADSATAVPIIRQTIARAIELSKYAPGSHYARDLMQFCETFPRDELFQVSPQQLIDLGRKVLAIGERHQTRVFTRNDDFGRFASVLVYLPRDRYTTDVRIAITEILERAYGSDRVDYVAWVSESVLARLHFVVRMPSGRAIPDVDEAALNRDVAHATQTWDDDFAVALVHELGEEGATDLLHQFGAALPEAYKEDVSPREAIPDIASLAALKSPGDSSVRLHDALGLPAGEHRFTLCRLGESVELFELLPVFASLGAHLLEERPYELTRADGESAWVYDVTMKLPSQNSEGLDPQQAARFCEAFLAAWRGDTEVDGLNALVSTTSLTWREVAWLRSWLQYARQLGSPFSYQYSERMILANGRIAELLVHLFRARLDPALDQQTRESESSAIDAELGAAIDAVASLDADRILRQLHAIVQGTLRTNAFQVDDAGNARRTLAIKLAPHQIPGVPAPVPAYEIWVSSPRVSGVHLRFGAVARGGLRWSDRPEDMRTEILGLVKAQMVKNAVIIPVGAKGGFIVKAPRDASDRTKWIEDGIACYREFITALLELTDNRVGGEVVPPKDTVRLDGDDTYLVVAADKGTASFSDIANEIAEEQGFWLGDAFASGGSHGYDHKEMGITARGAWESVKRHFREDDIDTQRDPITVVGVGDMSGDVFGNGMLLSESIRLVAAFDHRHVFLDPDPDPQSSFNERQRLADLDRSSWADYDANLLSAGGGVYARDLKTIPITDEVRTRLGLPPSVATLTPSEVVQAILLAPVDLLWNGGIGTYVKAAGQSNADVGDKANDAVRVNGRDLRCRVVGEGGNLGLTQAGRIEAARCGVQLNTDAIDNSAGVDCSDHEVNIKILLDTVVADGDLTVKQRNELLGAMTDDVSDHVLLDNYLQNQVLGYARAQAPALLPVHQRLMQSLEERGMLDRALEVLPSDHEIGELLAEGKGLSSPELCVLLSYAKIALTTDLSTSGLAQEKWFDSVLRDYFPPQVVQRYGAWLEKHPLRTQIISTLVANDMIDSGGITFVHRAIEESGASPVEVARAYTVAREVFGLRSVWQQISDLDGVVPTGAQAALHLEVRRLLDRATRWVLALRGGTVDVAGEINRFGATVEHLASVAQRLLVGSERSRFTEKAEYFVSLGAPKPLAEEVAMALDRFSLLDIDDIARRYSEPPEAVAELYFSVSEHYGIDGLLSHISALPRSDRWANLARAALRSDLYSVLAGLTSKVMRSTSDDDVAESRIAHWEERNWEGQQRARATLSEIDEAGHYDLATLSVALRVLRTLVQQGSSSAHPDGDVPAESSASKM